MWESNMSFGDLGYSERAGNPKQASFSPYDNNEGSIVAVAGDDFVVIASDTRLSTGYSIYSRTQPKLFKLSDRTVHACAGCWSDVLTLTRVVATRMKMYQYEHNKVMSTSAVSQLMATLLYYKRFFPYYVYNVLAGLDEDGKGWCYSYDGIGCKEREKFIASGSSAHLLQPLLDNQVARRNMESAKEEPLTVDRTVRLVKDIFVSATERDIYTGDSVIINVITKEGVEEMTFDLRKD